MGYPQSYKEIPFFRLLIPLVAGIGVALFVAPVVELVHIFILTIALFCIVFIALFISRKWAYRHVYGIVLNIFLFSVGYSLVALRPTTSTLIEGEVYNVVARLVEPPVVRERSIRVQVKLQGEWRNGLFYPINEHMLLYFAQDDSSAYNLLYGDVLALRIIPNYPSQPQNPGEFSYKSYLARRGIFSTAFVRADTWHRLGTNGNPIFAFAYTLQEKMITLLREAGLKDQELAVASALSIGYKTLLDDETRRVYSGSGAMHLLAVSGLHVGLLFVLLSWILASFKRTRVGRFVRFVVLILFLWFFAVLTGLSPSVQRSAFMFSMVALAEITAKRSSIFNTLSASAFVLLVLNPFNLVEIGFQLSYLAVFSILVFTPLLGGLVNPNNRIANWFWELLVVSVAAQLGTTAISIFYFNQFPSYFWVTNIFAVPLATVSLYLLIALYLLAPIPILSNIIGWLSNGSIFLLNKGLAAVESAPGATLHGLHLSGLQFALLMLLFVFAIWWVFTRRVKHLAIFLLVIAVFTGETAFKKIEQRKSAEVLIFSSYGKSAFAFVDCGSAVVLVDSTLYRNEQQRKFLLGKYLASRGSFSAAHYSLISDTTNLPQLLRSTSFAQAPGVLFADFKGSTIAIPLGDTLSHKRAVKPLEVDYLVVSHLCKLKPRALARLFSPRVVIVDSSVPAWNATLIFASFSPDQTRYWHTLSNGYYSLGTN